MAETSVKLTDFQIKVLILIHERPGITADRLSMKLWPDSIAHKRSYNTGYGACRGKGMWLTAGSHVGKLMKKGWVEHKARYVHQGRDRKGNDRGYGYDLRGYILTQQGEDLWSTIQCSTCGACYNDMPAMTSFILEGFPPVCDVCRAK